MRQCYLPPKRLALAINNLMKMKQLIALLPILMAVATSNAQTTTNKKMLSCGEWNTIPWKPDSTTTRSSDEAMRQILTQLDTFNSANKKTSS